MEDGFECVFSAISFAEFTTRSWYKKGSSSSSVSCASEGRSNTFPLDVLIDHHLDHTSTGTPTGGTQQGLALNCQVMLSICVHGLKYFRYLGNTHVYT